MKAAKKVLAEKPTPESFNSSTGSTPNSYSKKAFGKAKSRENNNFPKCPAKIKQVIYYLLQTLSSARKTDVCNATRLTCTPTDWGRPTVSHDMKDKVLSFLKEPDISYCIPGWKDIVYMGKDANGEKIFVENAICFGI